MTFPHPTLEMPALGLEVDQPPAGEASESLAAIHSILAEQFGSGSLSIYEAGGGSTSYLPRSVRERAKVTVVDIDPVQVGNNTYADEAILGDIQTHTFGRERFDLITCYNVIEHLPHVDAALYNFVTALRPGGMILIGAPNPRSLSGVVTKYTPHWFHVWFYRHIRGHERAGEPGEPPFPTFFHPLVTFPALRNFFASQGFQVVYERTYESPRYAEMRSAKPLLAHFVDTCTTLFNTLRFNRINVRHGDYHLIVRKPS